MNAKDLGSSVPLQVEAGQLGVESEVKHWQSKMANIPPDRCEGGRGS